MASLLPFRVRATPTQEVQFVETFVVTFPPVSKYIAPVVEASSVTSTSQNGTFAAVETVIVVTPEVEDSTYSSSRVM
jgi:hypothetical protein